MTTFRDVLKKNRANIETIAHCNTHVNEDGQVTISKNDPWFYEDEWDSHYKELTNTEHRHRIAAY